MGPDLGPNCLQMLLNVNTSRKRVKMIQGPSSGFYTKLNVWGSLGLNFEYDGGPIIEIGGPIFLDKL